MSPLTLQLALTALASFLRDHTAEAIDRHATQTHPVIAQFLAVDSASVRTVAGELEAIARRLGQQ